MSKDFRHRRDGEYVPHKSGRGSQRHRDDKWKNFEETNMRPVELDLSAYEESLTKGETYSKYRKKFTE